MARRGTGSGCREVAQEEVQYGLLLDPYAEFGECP